MSLRHSGPFSPGSCIVQGAIHNTRPTHRVYYPHMLGERPLFSSKTCWGTGASNTNIRLLSEVKQQRKDFYHSTVGWRESGYYVVRLSFKKHHSPLIFFRFQAGPISEGWRGTGIHGLLRFFKGRLYRRHFLWSRDGWRCQAPVKRNHGLRTLTAMQSCEWAAAWNTKLRRITLDHSAQSATSGTVDRVSSSTCTLWKSSNDAGIFPTDFMWWWQREIWVSSCKQSLHLRTHSCTAVSTTPDLYPRTTEKVYRSFYMLQDLCHPPRNGFQFVGRCLPRYVQTVYWIVWTLCYAYKWLAELAWSARMWSCDAPFQLPPRGESNLRARTHCLSFKMGIHRTGCTSFWRSMGSSCQIGEASSSWMLNNPSVTFEQMTMLLKQVQARLNSLPLYAC